MDRLVRKDFMAGENIRSAGEGFTAASAAYLNLRLQDVCSDTIWMPLASFPPLSSPPSRRERGRCERDAHKFISFHISNL